MKVGFLFLFLFFPFPMAISFSLIFLPGLKRILKCFLFQNRTGDHIFPIVLCTHAIYVWQKRSSHSPWAYCFEAGIWRKKVPLTGSKDFLQSFTTTRGTWTSINLCVLMRCLPLSSRNLLMETPIHFQWCLKSHGNQMKFLVPGMKGNRAPIFKMD